jgi:hypothetical protein
VRAHRTPAGFPIALSDEARAVVRRWYAADYEFLAVLAELGPQVGFEGELPAVLRG